jgi:plastocyanin
VRRRTALAGAGLAALALTPAAISQADGPEATAAAKKTVKVRDNFFAPSKLTVPRKSTITWKWPSIAGDIHDVYLNNRPKGVSKSFKRKFHSELAGSDYTFRRKLTVPGTYRIICTIHEGMKMTIKVRK